MKAHESGSAVLAGDLEARMLAAVRRIIHAVDVDSRQLQAGFHITGPQLNALGVIVREGGITAREIADRIHVGPSTLVGVLDRLEAKELIRRQRDRADRRRVRIVATPAGRRLLRLAPSPLGETLQRRFAGLPEAERLRLAAALERVADLIERPSPDPE